VKTETENKCSSVFSYMESQSNPWINVLKQEHVELKSDDIHELEVSPYTDAMYSLHRKPISNINIRHSKSSAESIAASEATATTTTATSTSSAIITSTNVVPVQTPQYAGNAL
jgi:hypothetical protein